MKIAKSQAYTHPPSVPPKPRTGPRTFSARVTVGDVISFDPTGEQLRVAKIESDRITFEKLP